MGPLPPDLVDTATVDPIALDEATLIWLLDPADPSLRARVLVELLDRSPGDADVVDARQAIPTQPFVRANLDAWTSGRVLTLGPYQKYRGATWTLAFLAEMGLPASHAVAREGVAYLLREARSARRLRGVEVTPLLGADPVYWLYPVACLTARLVTVLSRFGHPDHPVTRGARATLVHLYQPGCGFDCRVLDRSLLPACIMTLPETLKSLLAIPGGERTDAEQHVIEDAVRTLQAIELYRYVPADGHAFAEATRDLPVEETRARKAEWAAQGRLAERAEKPSWLRFSFPHGYNPDLLEVLSVLGAAGTPRSPTIDRGLALVLSKRCRGGRWRQTGGLNGKMWDDRGEKGREDPWITYRALAGLKAFGLLRA